MKIRDLMKRNKIYESVYQQMMGYQSAYLGGLAFKQGVRRKRPSEDSTLYLDLVSNTVAQPICRYIVDTINDVLFEPGVKRDVRFCTPSGDYIDPENCEWAELFLLDSDLQNRDMTGFMEQVGDLTSIFGHCWVGVDMPLAAEGNLGRPYVVAISPLDVWDWEWDFYGGKPILKYVKVKEAETHECYYIKCYHLGNSEQPSYWRSYVIPKNQVNSQQDGEAEMKGADYFPAGMSIPLFLAYGRQDPRCIDLGVSDIDSATDAQREHYKLECEAYSSLQFAKTLIRADKGVAIPVHAGAIVRATQGQIEAIKVDTGDVGTIMSKQQDILEQIEALTGLGGLRATKNKVASGTSIIEERKQLHRTAKAKSRLMEITEELIFTYAARFMDMRWAGEISYNTDYEQYDTDYRLALMSQAKALIPDNAIINSLIGREIITLLAPPTDIQDYQLAYTESIQDPVAKTLMTDQDHEVNSRDLGDQIPNNEDYTTINPTLADDTKNAAYESTTGAGSGDPTALGGAGTPIQNTGQSLYPQQSIAVQLTGLNTGR